MTERLDRMLDYLPSWWDTDVGSITYEWMLSVSDELDRFDIESDNLRLSLFVDTALGEELDSIGALFRLARKPAESDEFYRARIKSAAAIFRSSGTKPGIISAIVDLAGVDPSDVVITEDFPANPLKFQVEITFPDQESLDLKDAAVEAIQDAKAAGVYAKILLTIGGELLTDVVDCDDTVLISLVVPGSFFTIDVSLIDGSDLLS